MILNRGDIILQKRRSEAFGLALHGVHKIGAENTVRESGEVLHFGGVDELSSRCQRAGDDQGAVAGAAEIDGRGVACRARSDNDCVLFLFHDSTIRFACRMRHRHSESGIGS